MITNCVCLSSYLTFSNPNYRKKDIEKRGTE